MRERSFFNEIRPKEPFRERRREGEVERGAIIAGLLFVRCEEGGLGHPFSPLAIQGRSLSLNILW